MSNKTIDMNKKYTYRNGAPARILCVDAREPGPVISLDQHGYPLRHYEDGSRNEIGSLSEYDLLEVKEEKTLEFWVNVYPKAGISVRLSKSEAAKYALEDRIVCKKVIITYCEGDEE
jgi:hypothetical protein